jgi:hypothetical protein
MFWTTLVKPYKIGRWGVFFWKEAPPAKAIYTVQHEALLSLHKGVLFRWQTPQISMNLCSYYETFE